MTTPQPRTARHTSAADTTQAVTEFMAALEHPRKALVQALRLAILDTDPAVAEGIKWNAPSFRTTEYFATTHLREKRGVGIILHLGAKVREAGPGSLAMADPMSLLKWLAKDRAIIVFADEKDLLAKKRVFQDLLRQWLAHV